MAALECVFAGDEKRETFDEYLAKGCRRFGNVIYRNICKTCSACVPMRVETGRFTLSDSQKRTLSKNRDTRVEISHSPSVTQEKIELYRKYLSSKHAAGEEGEVPGCESLLLLHYSFPSTIEMDFFAGDRLIGVGIVDVGDDSFSSNYFYYDTDYLGRRPGVFSILSEISLARRMEKKYYYLGFYIKETPKMSYKKYFRPNHVYENGEWKEFLP
jgi:arginine-tRNA-protein transferase